MFPRTLFSHIYDHIYINGYPGKPQIPYAKILGFNNVQLDGNHQDITECQIL